MTPEIAKLLLDVLNACREIQRFSVDRTREDLASDRTLQLVMERLVEIVGEALRQAEHSDPSIINRVPDLRDIVGSRNRIVHEYDNVNYGLLWDIVEFYIPSLQSDIEVLLEDAPELEDS